MYSNSTLAGTYPILCKNLGVSKVIRTKILLVIASTSLHDCIAESDSVPVRPP
jgi:hypothetical protein